MKREIQLDIVTPTGPLFSEHVEFLSIMGPSGSIGILPNHLPLFMLVDVGFLEFQKNGQRDFFTTMGGILEFHNNHATVLTESAERAADIDELRAKQSAEKAQAHLSEQAGVEADAKADMLAALQRARTRLRVVELLRSRHSRKTI
ncbi:MAG: ATP synthase F1 subunit epsilon [Candidatus Sericytochromatia bacterium]